MTRGGRLPGLFLCALAALALAPSSSAAATRVQVTSIFGDFQRVLVRNDSVSESITIRTAPPELGSAVHVVTDRPAEPGPGCNIFASAVNTISCRPSRLASVDVITGTGTDRDADRVDLSELTHTDARSPNRPVGTLVESGGGNDTIIGSRGDDRVNLGPGRDLVDSGDGSDQIADGQGDDVLLLGSGGDFVTPAFGDPVTGTPDSDIVSGGPGFDGVSARGTVTLGDALCNDGSAADAPADPTGNPRLVNAPEGALRCSGTDADRDLLAGVEGLSTDENGPVDFTGTDAENSFFGGGGDDRFEAGGGLDFVMGLGGNDLLLQRDELVDRRTDCGGEATPADDSDRAVVDPDDPVETNCETIERGGASLPGPVGGGEEVPSDRQPPSPPDDPPPSEEPPGGERPPDPPDPDPIPASPPAGEQPSNPDEGPGPGGGDDGVTPPEVEIPTATAFVVRGRISVRVRCVYRARNCVGRLTVTAAQRKRAAGRRVRRGERLARGNVNVPWGKSEPTTMRAPRRLRDLLRGLGARSLRVRLTVTARDGAAPAGATTTTASRVVRLGFQGR